MGMESGAQKRLTLLDWMLLGGTFLALLIGIPLWLYSGGEAEGVQIRYTVCISGVQSSFLEEAGEIGELIPVGSAVGSERGTALLGAVETVEKRPHIRPVVKEGKVDFEADPHRLDVYITVLGDAKEREGDGFRIGDIRISAGERGSFRFGGFYASDGLVLSAERVEE
jgi:hypothetical protein